MQVLIVEDDAALGVFLQKGLKLEGHEVDWVGDGETALEYVSAKSPDLIVLDLSLPRKDGIEVLAEIKGRFGEPAVLVLTGRSNVEERVRCLNLGADDCLLKPFSFHELTARCRALLRRRDRSSPPLLQHGDVELNRMERRAWCRGAEVSLTVKEFRLLEFLLQHKGRCCSRAELLQQVWQMSAGGGTNVVDVYINYLRKKMTPDQGDGEDRGSFIETVRGAGYRIGGELRLPASASRYAQQSFVAGA